MAFTPAITGGCTVDFQIWRRKQAITILFVKTRYLLFWSIGLLVAILAASAIWFITDPFGFLNAT